MKKQLNRILIAIVCLSLLLPLLPTVPAEAGSFGNLYYKISEGEAIITGCVETTTGELTLPAEIEGYPVTAIDFSAFRNRTKLTSVIISEGIMTIGGSAFEGCSGLLTVTIPDSIIEVGEYAFESCDSLQFNVYHDVNYLGNEKNPYRAMIRPVNDTLETLIAHPQTKLIAGYAFYKHGSCLTTVVLPEGLERISNGAFRGCKKLTSINIPTTTIEIASFLFYECESLTTISLPEGLTKIDSSMFGFCKSLSNVYIPDSVTEIASAAFHNCKSLTNISLPKNLTTIDSDVFFNCTNLIGITFPKTLTSIGNRAFGNCNSLTEVIIPESVTKIDDLAFYDCDNLTSVTLPEGITSIGNMAFSFCQKLVDINIPDSVTTIGEQAIGNCISITQITLGDRVESIGKNAFRSCLGISEITIPESVTSIADQAFYSCKEIKSIYFRGDAPTFGADVFSGSNNRFMVCADVYYYADADGWTDDVKQNYGGELTWIASGSLQGGITTAGSGVESTITAYPVGSQKPVCTRTVNTDAYSLDFLPLGEYTVTVTAKNHAARSYPVTISGRETELNPEIRLIGDVTGDGKVNMGDVARLFSHTRGSTLLTDAYTLVCADATEDGKVNMGDVARIFSHAKKANSLWK